MNLLVASHQESLVYWRVVRVTLLERRRPQRSVSRIPVHLSILSW